MKYRFDRFDIDADARELFVDGERRETEPKTFDLLVFLVRHRDRAVSKDELLAELWPRQIVTETALTRAIMKARRAVGDSASRQAIIRTVHGHGYRFTADVEEFESTRADAPPPEAAAGQSAAQGKPSLLRRSALASLAAALLLAIAAGWYTSRTPVAGQFGSLAVLPVRNQVAGDDTAWVRLGLMSLLQRMLDEGGVEVVADQPVLAAVDALDDDALATPPGPGVFEALQQRTGADSLLYTTLDRDAGLYRLAAVLLHPDGRKTRRIIVGAALAQLSADMADVLVELLHGATERSRNRFAKTSTDPFVNELYARALDLELQGHIEEARQLFTVAAEQEPELFWLRYEIALCTRDLREWESASEQFAALTEEARAGSDRRALVVALNSHGVMELQRSRYDRAERLFLEARDAAGEAASLSDRATVFVNLALIASRRGRLDDAAAYYESALDLYDELDRQPPPTFLNNYAGLLARQGRLEDARAFSEQAVQGFRVMGHRRFEAPSLNRLAGILRRLGELESAIERHQEAIAIYRELDNVVGELSATGGLTAAYRDRGDLSRARATAQSALDRARGVDDELLLGDALMRLGQVEAAADRDAVALPLFEEALVIFDRLQDDEGQLGARTAIGYAALALGDIDRAERVAGQLLAAAEEKGSPLALARAQLLAGRADEIAGRTAQAGEQYDAALNYARAFGDRVVRRRAAIRLGELELKQGHVDAAASLADEAAEIAAGHPDYLRFAARVALAAGDNNRAVALLEQLREIAGETWTDEDAGLLADARS